MTTMPATDAAPTPAATAPVSAPAPPTAARPYNPNAALSQLDALALPDEASNEKLSSELLTNVATLMATKEENARREQKVGATLASKVKLMEEEQRKLAFIRAELSKLDQSLSRNIDVLRAEIESVGREVNTLQKDFEWKEQQYMTCRKSLAKAKQRKLMLTSHLDFIILTNENEKARKLAELERELGLTPSTPPTMHAMPVLPLPNPASAAAGATVSSPNGIVRSSGPSPAAVQAAAESAARHQAALAAAHVPKDHPGLRLDALAPPGFAGFDEPELGTHPAPQLLQQTHASIPASAALSSVSHGPSPAATATSRHVSMPPRSSPSSTSLPRPPVAAQSSLSLAPKNSGPHAYTSDGTFAGFSE